MLARACRVLGTELRGWELIRPGMKSEQQKSQEGEAGPGGGEEEEEDGSSSGDFETGYEPSGSVLIDIRIGELNEDSAMDEHKEKVTQAEWSTGPSNIASDEFEGSIRNRKSPPSMFDVSEADVARIVPRVISHRVRMRDGWMDEVLAGAVCGAAFSVGESESKDIRGRDDMTVKDILVRILQKV